MKKMLKKNGDDNNESIEPKLDDVDDIDALTKALKEAKSEAKQEKSTDKGSEIMKKMLNKQLKGGKLPSEAKPDQEHDDDEDVFDAKKEEKQSK